MKTTSWEQIKAILRSLASTLNQGIANAANIARTALEKANSASATAQSKMNANNPVGTGSFSMGRKEGSNVGDDSHAEGYSTTASGDSAHAEGIYSESIGQGTHAEGYSTQASGRAAHAEGFGSRALGSEAHAEGHSTEAKGAQSHAEGNSTKANGLYSHSEGSWTEASGENSHAEGEETIASGECQHVQGRYNVEDTENKYLHIVGNGEIIDNGDDREVIRSNAHTLDWDGNGWYAGDLYVGGTSQDDASKVLTNADIDSIADAVIAKIPAWEGGEY